MSSLHLHTWNEGNDTIPIIALHGFTGCGLDFECFTQNTQQNFSWYAPDLMGHGQTLVSKNLEDYSFPAHISYLDLIAEKIGKPFILLGYSMGGRLALKYALERPHFISKLILVSSSPGILDNSERKLRQDMDAALASKILEEGVNNFLMFWQEQPLIKSSQNNIPESIHKPILTRKSQNNALGLANSLKRMGTGTMDSHWNRLTEIDFPLTMITGENDKKFLEIAQQVKLMLPHAIHKVIPETGHAAIWENPEAFTSILIGNPVPRTLLNLTTQ